MATKKRPQTPNRGAADTRSQIKRIIRAEWKKFEKDTRDAYMLIRDIIASIDGMPERSSAKRGGLGRK